MNLSWMAVSEWIIKSELRGRCLDMVKGVVEESLRGSKLGEMKFRNNILNRMFMERGKYFEDLFLMDFQLEDLSDLWIENLLDCVMKFFFFFFVIGIFIFVSSAIENKLKIETCSISCFKKLYIILCFIINNNGNIFTL